MEVKFAIYNRHSVRSFLEQEVGNDLIEQLLDSARHAPNSCNMQTINYVVITDKNLRNKLSTVATKKMLWAPVNILLMVDSRFTTKRHSSVTSLGAAMQNICLTATSLGLGTCPMAGFENDKKIKEILNIPNYFDLKLLIAVGFPEKTNKESERIPLSEMMHYNSFDSSKYKLEHSNNSSKWSIEKLTDYRRRIAPVYRYSNRFSLGTYLPDVYVKLVAVFNDFATSNELEGKKLLDLFTYDGMFARELIGQAPDMFDITVSDFVEYILKQNKDFGQDVSTLLLEPEKLPQQLNYDIISLVHKLQFLPRYQDFLIDLAKVVKKGSFLFIVFDTQSNFIWQIKRLRLRIKSAFKGELYNVYENNPYYKIGPYAPVSKTAVYRLLKQHGFRLLQDGIVDSSTRKRSNQSQYAIFKRQ